MTDFFTWQIEHYAQRLSEERAQQNWKAVSFLRDQLHKLKTALKNV